MFIVVIAADDDNYNCNGITILIGDAEHVTVTLTTTMTTATNTSTFLSDVTAQTFHGYYWFLLD